MSFTLLPVSMQGDGQFNRGAILEKKPVVLSRDGKGLTPYSNLFYWAHAWSEGGSTIGEHPHQGFEILSFVLKGSIEHYDSSSQKWIPLQEGDVQIIRAGNGISHSEKLLPKSEMFQIWFDPNLQESIEKPASYNDYQSATFPEVSYPGYTEKIFKGEGAPMIMDTPGVQIRKVTVKPGELKMPLEQTKTYSLFVLDGRLIVNDQVLHPNDFIKIEGEQLLNASAPNGATLFLIDTPSQPGYPTYAARYVR